MGWGGDDDSIGGGNADSRGLRVSESEPRAAAIRAAVGIYAWSMRGSLVGALWPALTTVGGVMGGRTSTQANVALGRGRGRKAGEFKS